MEFRVLGSFGGDSPDCRMTSFLVDGEVVVDAGAITRALTIEEQRRVRHVLISHTHMDHTATLPFLIENIFGTHPEPVSIYCAKQVMGAVRRHLFNNDTWPDFTRIPTVARPAIRYVVLKPEVPTQIAGYTVRSILVSHTIECGAVRGRRKGGAIAYSGDTGPTNRLCGCSTRRRSSERFS